MSKFIQPGKLQTQQFRFTPDGKKVPVKSRIPKTGIDAALMMLKKGLKDRYNKDAKEMYLVWNYIDKVITMSITFQDGTTNETVDTMANQGAGETFGDIQLESIRSQLKKCKTVVQMYQACSFETSALGKQWVRFINEAGEKKYWSNDGK